MKIVAFLVVRNEEVYIEKTIEYLIQNNISIVIVDNDSTDNTVGICKKYYPEHVIKIYNLPFDGTFNLQLHIQEVKKLASIIEADWFISHSADEKMSSDIEGESLYDAIVRVDELGFDVVNLDEFVFVYENNQVDYTKTIFHNTMRHYYFFEPSKYRLMRILKKTISPDGALAGVHNLENNNINLYEHNFILQHYPLLSYQHAKQKYLTRIYSKDDVKLGWHGNRVNMTKENLVSPNISLLNKKTNGVPFDKSKPYKTHFWEWSPTKC